MVHRSKKVSGVPMLIVNRLEAIRGRLGNGGSLSGPSPHTPLRILGKVLYTHQEAASDDSPSHG